MIRSGDDGQHKYYKVTNHTYIDTYTHILLYIYIYTYIHTYTAAAAAYTYIEGHVS